MKNLSKAQKQSRLLYIIMISALVVAAIIIAATGNARKSSSDETTPPVEVTVTESEENMEPDVETEAVLPATEKTDVGVAAEPIDVLPQFRAPAAGIVTKNHCLDVAVYSVTMNDYRTHTGVDVSGEVGGEVYATADGVVGEIWEDPMMGVCMTVLHSGDAVSTYRNLAPEMPEGIVAGCAVYAGQVIAAIGESALIEVADEPHLHYELSVSGSAVNPQEYMTFATEASVVE